MKLMIAAIYLLCAISVSAQKFDVKVIDHQNHDTNYTYVVPGQLTAHSTTNTDCDANNNNVSCTGSTTTSGTVTPPRQVSYSVSGSTFSLLLPDGRVAIVNCNSKFAERFAGVAGNHQSCREPLVDNIQAEFRGDNAKLMWVVSLDGKKIQSETYKVLAILDKPKSAKN